MASPVAAQFHSATSVEDALERLDELGSDARIIAGGTDVMVQLQDGQLTPKELVHIDRIPGLDHFDVGEQGMTIGAMVTHENLWRHTRANNIASLSEAAKQVGGWQTQALGTIVGNVVNASPAADLLPGLLVHDAVLHLASKGAERTVRVEDFVLGRRKTALEPREMVTKITTGPLPAGAREAFVKVGRRKAMEVSIVAVAARIALDDAGAISDARLAVGAASLIPYRARRAEEMLIGLPPSQKLFTEAGRIALDGADPVDDVRASRRYRLAVLPRAVTRALAVASEEVNQMRSVA